MRDDYFGIMLTVFIAGAAALFGFSLGASTSLSEYQSKLISRGLQEYDKQTGRLVWTEKAGGEKGGDK